jgi:hypothetical protein
MKTDSYTRDKTKETKEGLKLVVVYDDNDTPVCLVQEYLLGTVNQYQVLTPADGEKFHAACRQLKLKRVITYNSFG